MNYDTVPVPMDIGESLLAQWQTTIDLLCRFVDVPVALVMRINGSDIEVFVSSNSPDNPFHPGEAESLVGSGSYCEAVVQTKEKLLVADALASPKWLNNPRLKLGFVSYLGFPILLPDGSVFGTICVLDTKQNAFCSDAEELLVQFKDLFEAHLQLNCQNLELARSNAEVALFSAKLQELGRIDQLTGLRYRHTFDEVYEREMSRAHRTNGQTCLVLCDIDHFRQINSELGHKAGDEALSHVAAVIIKRMRKHDWAWRWGGDEFLLLLPDTGIEGGAILANDIRRTIEDSPLRRQHTNHPLTASFGVTTIEKNEEVLHCLERCDHLLHEAKHAGRNTVKKGSISGLGAPGHNYYSI